jgi:FkbM family methyltransferase
MGQLFEVLLCPGIVESENGIMKIRQRIDNFFGNSASMGLRNALSWLWYATLLRQERCLIWLPHCPKPIQIRTQTSDFVLIKQILPSLINWKPNVDPVNVIVDAGANIGVFSIIMANQYPQARVIAIEPDVENLAMLSENCKPYPNISILPAALWHKQEPLSIANPDEAHWARQVASLDSPMTNQALATVEAVTVFHVLDLYGIQTIDLFKIDIEGAEKDIFKLGDLTWLNQVRELLMELHWVSGENIQDIFFNALRAYPHQAKTLGEYEWIHFDREHLTHASST